MVSEGQCLPMRFERGPSSLASEFDGESGGPASTRVHIAPAGGRSGGCSNIYVQLVHSIRKCQSMVAITLHPDSPTILPAPAWVKGGGGRGEKRNSEEKGRFGARPPSLAIVFP
eukprot:5661863-Pyramimonas_sp.AAC.1